MPTRIELEELKQRIDELPVNDRGRRRYTSAVKRDVIAYMRQRQAEGASQGGVGAELGIHQATLSEWTGRRQRLVEVQSVDAAREAEPLPVVVLASGARIEGLDLDAIIRLAKALS